MNSFIIKKSYSKCIFPISFHLSAPTNPPNKYPNIPDPKTAILDIIVILYQIKNM